MSSEDRGRNNFRFSVWRGLWLAMWIVGAVVVQRTSGLLQRIARFPGASRSLQALDPSPSYRGLQRMFLARNVKPLIGKSIAAAKDAVKPAAGAAGASSSTKSRATAKKTTTTTDEVDKKLRNLLRGVDMAQVISAKDGAPAAAPVKRGKKNVAPGEQPAR